MSAPMAKNGLRLFSKHTLLCMPMVRVTLRTSSSLSVLTELSHQSLQLTCHYNPLQQQVNHFGLSSESLSSTYVDLWEDDLHRAKEYLHSKDYEEKYSDKPVWASYRRNFKGQVPPEKTRKQCIRGKGEDRKVCSNACPICQDEDLHIDYRNTHLLEQFICPHSWEIYSYQVTGVCQEQYKKLVTAIDKARSYGLIPYEVQHIHYNYDDYYKKQQLSTS